MRVFGLHQYARSFADAGLSELDTVANLTESDSIEFLERLHIFPGHRLRLLRAIDCLRFANGARNVAQMLEDDIALDRLSAQKDQLTQEKLETEGENKKLQEEIGRLTSIIREQGGHLQKARDRIAELGELVQAQTEQVNFLVGQLQTLSEGDPEKENKLYRSYRDSFDDWGSAQKIVLPDLDMLKTGTFSPKDFGMVTQAPKESPSQEPLSPKPRGFKGAGLAVPQRAQMAKSLDSGCAEVTECLAGFDVENVIRCASSAIQNKIIMSTAKSRPHTAEPDVLEACSIFLAPECREKLLQLSSTTMQPGDGDLSFCSALMASEASGCREILGKAANPLNALALRTVPNKWDIFHYCRNIMLNFRLQPEVSVITVFYLDRFSETSGVALTPDNWQRLVITAMMLASKVWDDESFENVEFAQLCPLYTLEEINTFERIFLKSVEYNMSVKGSEYAKAYFLLRTLGARDAADFGLQPMDPVRASRLAERCLEKQIEFRERFSDPSVQRMNWTM